MLSPKGGGGGLWRGAADGLQFLEDKGYRFALIGGVALAAYGLARS